MSYCRFSSDNFGCDVYAYEDAMGGFTIHVAESRVMGDVPKLPDITSADSDEFFKAYRKQMDFLDTAKREKIGLPEDGETFRLGTPQDCANKLKELKDIGYNVPQYAIDSLLDEVDDEGQ